MTPPKTLYRVRLAIEVRQEAEVEVWAESREEAEMQAPLWQVRWSNDEITGPWVVSIEEAT
jgi:hypothetical protein